MSDVTAIIVSYNSATILPTALSSLQSQKEIVSVIVVDNASGDDSCDIIKKKFPSAILIKNAKNEGFGRANNIALSRVKTPYALLINPDAAMEEGAVAALVAAAKHYEDAAIIAPALYDGQDKLLHTYKRNIFVRENRRTPFIVPEGDLCAEFVSGAVMLFNMGHMKKVGFFDPAIFLYYEDDDICLRARKAGHSVVLTPEAKAVHLVGHSSSPQSNVRKQAAADFFKQKHMVWSRLYIEEKYHGKAQAKLLGHKLSVQYAIKAAVYLLLLNTQKMNRYRGRLTGVFEFSAKGLLQK